MVPGASNVTGKPTWMAAVSSCFCVSGGFHVKDTGFNATLTQQWYACSISR